MFDNSISACNYFGVFCKYTITRADKFWFDDFNVSGMPPVYGCTDMLACNYNMYANFDDGSCDLPDGCGDPLYIEYNPLVTCSDPLDCLTIITGSIKYLQENKRIFKIFDLLGRDQHKSQQVLFYLYEDGIIEKRICIE